MPWKEVTAVNERMEFVARLKGGERMSDLCREFGISRKTGYKFEQRYDEQGPRGLYDVSRRPRRLARQISTGIQTAILELKQEKPTWGAAKIHEVLGRKHRQMDCRFEARFMICWIVTDWLRSGPNGGAIMPIPHCKKQASRLQISYGAPTSRDSSGWGMRDIAIPSPLPIFIADICWAVRRWRAPSRRAPNTV